MYNKTIPVLQTTLLVSKTQLINQKLMNILKIFIKFYFTHCGILFTTLTLKQHMIF